MKFLCPACERLTAFSGFRADGDLLVLRCSRCGVESRSRASVAEALGAVATVGRHGASAAAPAFGLKAVPSPTSAAEAAVANGDAWSVPEGHCPKCIAVRPPQANSCAQCGLLFENFKPEELEPPPGIADQFQRLLSTWEDIEAHDRLVQAALIQGELATVGRLYRIRLARAPQDAYAARGRDEVLRLATASSTGLAKAESSDDPHALGLWKYVLVFAILAACTIAFWVLFRQLRTVTS